MNILVTGGGGFIGGHLAESLVREGHDVTVLDNLDPYYDVRIKQKNIQLGRRAAQEHSKSNPAEIKQQNNSIKYGETETHKSSSHGSYEFIKGDVRDTNLIERLIDDADIVYHHAAQAGVRTSVDDPHKSNNINVYGTLNVLEAARDTKIERVVLASSSSVYGKSKYLPYDEAHPKSPMSPYGVSKLTGEQYARTYHEIYDLPTVSLRYFTVYGPRMRPNMAISNFTSRCLNGEPPVIYGDGSQTRDFTYIDDVVAINQTLLNDDSADGEILNVGSTENIDIQTLAEIIRDEIDPSLDLKYTEKSTGDAQHTHADVSKARELLGYEPSTSIRKGVLKYIDWYRRNRNWYEPFVLQS